MNTHDAEPRDFRVSDYESLYEPPGDNDSPGLLAAFIGLWIYLIPAIAAILLGYNGPAIFNAIRQWLGV